MRIYIMRHGEAHTFAPSDAERPLTERGQECSVQMAKQLGMQLDKLDMVWVSPYLRAQQTWQAMAPQLPEAQRVMTVDEITPYGHPDDVLTYLKALAAIEQPETLLIVSHLPLVGYLTADLVPGIQPPMFHTSAVAAIEFDLETEQAELLWHANPELLK